MAVSYVVTELSCRRNWLMDLSPEKEIQLLEWW
jgi:hypothetical protein